MGNRTPLSDGQKKEIYRDVRLFHGAIHLFAKQRQDNYNKVVSARGTSAHLNHHQLASPHEDCEDPSTSTLTDTSHPHTPYT